MEPSIKAFFSSPYFAVVGASNDPAKYGYKVFRWYLAHALPVTPINPRATAITLSSTPGAATYPTVPTLSDLPHPTETAVSIITPPAVTSKVLDEARRLGIKAVWLQPGSFDDQVLAQAKSFPAGVAGPGGQGGEGWCVLVDGEMGLALAERVWTPQKL